MNAITYGFLAVVGLAVALVLGDGPRTVGKSHSFFLSGGVSVTVTFPGEDGQVRPYGELTKALREAVKISEKLEK